MKCYDKEEIRMEVASIMKKWIRITLCLLVLMGMLAGQAFAAEPTASTNQLWHNYVNGARWATPSFSALSYDETAKIYTRVECVDSDILVERYDSELNFLDAKSLEMELPLYGGFHSGKDAYILVFGQNNEQEDDATEVIRVVKFDKNWNRLGQASLFGANTIHPFDAGSLDFAEYNGYLYIRTCHEMYTNPDDGLNHQANLTVNIRISDMKITDSFYGVMNNSYGYVSHSFNQFIAIDEQNKTIVGLDHGDAYPRSVVLTKYYSPAGQDRFMEKVKVPYPEKGPGWYTWVIAETADVLPISSSSYFHYNDTGVTVGGLEISDSAYLTVGTSVDQTPEKYDPIYGQRNVYLTVTKKDLSETKVIWLTDFAEGTWTDVHNPYMVKLSGDRFMIIWSDGTETFSMHHVLVDGSGNLLGKVQSLQIEEESWLSDCHPIVAEGKVIWYMTNHSEPQFFTIEVDSGVLEPSVPEKEDPKPEDPKPEDPKPEEPKPSNPFVDVAQEKYYYDPVLWAVENDITKGVDNTHFGPETGCSRGHVVTFLWRAVGSPEPETNVNPFTDVKEGKFYYKAVLWAVEKGITSGVSDTAFAPDKTCTRGQIVTFLWRYAGKPQPAGTASFSDVKASAFYADAVAWAVEAEVTSGMGGGKFAPEATCTRGQVVTFLYRTEK